MRVNTKEPFERVFSLYEHPQLGYLLEFMAVQLMPTGNYSLLAQKLHYTTAEDFGADKDAIDLVKILDETEPEFLIKKFYPAKKTIRASDFFTKHYNDDLHAKIRPFIEKRILKVLGKLGEHKLFLSKDKNYTHTQLEIEPEKASILFHFRRNENGTNYFATIKLGDQKISFSQNNSELIIHEPAWLLCDNRLITFQKDTEGNKIKPFLHKKFISIPRKSEALYFEKFVKTLIEGYDVYAQGFEIRSERFRAFPVLKLTRFSDERLCAALYFTYGPYQFPHHSQKMVSVSLEKQGNDYIFHRIKRSKKWEHIIVSVLERIGLKVFEGSLFIPKKEEQNLLTLLSINVEELKLQGFVLDQSNLNRTYHIGDSKVSFSISKNKDWFDLEAIVRFGKFEVPFIRLKQYILSGNREFDLPDGSIAIIPEEWFTQYSSLFDFAHQKSDKLQIKKYHFGLLEGVLDGRQFRQSEKIKPFNPDEEYAFPKDFKAVLRPYQITAYRWLRYMDENSFGACLADDMGLGKTIEVLSFLQYRKEYFQSHPDLSLDDTTEPDKEQLRLFPEIYKGVNIKTKTKPFCILVVVPTSLIYNWLSEAKKFSTLNIFVHTGFNRSKDIKRLVSDYDVIISSYGTIRNDIDLFAEIKFDTIVLDESQAIKNPASQTSISVNQLVTRQKIVMTGTPVENSITDLWSQINFLNPGILGNFNFFNKRFVNSIERDKDEKETENLKNIVRPFILRRTKEQVAADLPSKTEKIIYCEMTEEQSQKYESIKSLFRNELLNAISNEGFKKSNLMILNGLIKLRQIANHPVLAEEDYLAGSGKFEQIILSLQNAVDSGHKVLVFSQFVQHLNLLRKHLDAQNSSYYYIAGNVPAMERKQLVDKFQTGSEAAIFLISLKAGGTGLNLTAADYVFLLDPWWNPAVERQAMDRTHRIGQDKPVFVYKFITKDTIEEKIVNLQQKKQKVSDDLLDTEQHFVNNLQEDTLKNLLE
ncbi:MAG: DEAD/DEAH box helicase [Bacteroidia bacterium]